ARGFKIAARRRNRHAGGVRSPRNLNGFSPSCSQTAKLFPMAPECARPRAQPRGTLGGLEHHPRRSTIPESLRPRTGALRFGWGLPRCETTLIRLKNRVHLRHLRTALPATVKFASRISDHFREKVVP